MDYKKPLICDLCCYSTQDLFPFTCGHNLCFLCLPFFLVQNMKSKGLSTFFFQTVPCEYSCMLCKTGKSLLFIEKMFSSNKPVSSNERTLLCSCGAQKLERFCVDCEYVVCELCYQQKHKIHQLVYMKDIKFDTEVLMSFSNDIMRLCEKFEDQFNTANINLLNEVNLTIDSIITNLQNLRQKLKEKLIVEQEKAAKQIAFIRNSSSLLLKDIASKNVAHKLYKLNQQIIKESQNFKNFDIFLPDFQELKNLSTSISDPDNYLKDLFEVVDFQTSLNLQQNDDNYNNFHTNPSQLKGIEFLKEIPWDCGKWVKSKKFLNFSKEKQTFLVWIGDNSSIQIYNYSLKSMVSVLKSQTGTIECLDIFVPNMLLMSGGSEGIIKVWDLNDFKQIFSFNAGGDILSAIIFKDIYSEINNDYLFVVSYDKKTSPIKIFDKTGELMRVLSLNDNKYCATIAYFYDKMLSKTFLLFGISKIGIKLYDLKHNLCVKQFKNTTHVNSLNFIKLKNYELYDHIIYTNQTGQIYLANIKEGEILIEKKLENSVRIWDLCIWNEEFSILATNDNTLKVIDNKAFNMVKSMKTSDSAINILKFKDLNNNNGGECLISIQDDRKIMIYTDK